MELIFRKDLIAAVPDRWARQYKNYTDTCHRWDKGPITAALKALEPGFTAEQVDEIIGNKSWTRFECSLCRKPQEVMLSLADGDDYESNVLHLCAPCLRKGLRLFNEPVK